VSRPTTTRRPAARGSSSPAPGAKTARGRATQAALVRAAQTVFERDGFLDARIADVTAHHRAYLETYHRNAKMMRVVEEVTNVSDSFRRERTARAQTWIEASREAVGKLQREGRADPDLDPLTTARAL
jgi:IMP cyclohydrolase